MFRKSIFAIMLASMLAATPAYAFASTYETEVTNNIAVGDVSISLAEYEAGEDGEESAYVDNKTVIPGQTVSKIARVTNEANEAWVRARLDFVTEGGLSGLSDDNVEVTDGWEKHGDYWYLLTPLKTGESVDFIKSVRVPAEWDASNSGEGFSVIVTADAVQSANFTPDFTSDDPWFGTVIETCVHTSYDASETSGEAFSVVFENGAEGLVRTGDDFFSNWGSLMPGDTASDTVTIGNNYGKTVSFYFRTETVAEDDLLKALNLTIKLGDTVIYDGAMDGEITDGVKLCDLESGNTAELTYTVSVPAGLTNEYALAQTKTRWIFSVNVNSGSTVSNNSGSKTSGGYSGGTSSSGDASSSGGSETSSTKDIENEDVPTGDKDGIVNQVVEAVKTITNMFPKTGDSGIEYYAGAIFLLSGMILMLILYRARNKKKEGQHEA